MKEGKGTKAIIQEKSANMLFSTKIARLTFATAALILFGISYSLYIQINDLDDSYKKVNQTNIVKLKLEQTLSTLKDAETAQRGFLLTKDSIFLVPYFGAYNRVKTLVGEIKPYIDGNTSQQRDLNALSTFIEVRFRVFSTQIAQYNQPGVNAATKKQHLLNSQASMDSIKYHINAINGEEDRLLSLREARQQKHRYLTPFLAFLLIITALTMLIFSYDKIMEQLKRTKKLLQQLKGLNNKLKQKNHELELYNKELDSFTYIASHDLKEPLRKIMTFTSMIEESGQDLSDKNKERLHKIHHSARRMQLLLNDLLDYSHTSLREKEFELVSLNHIIDEVEQHLKEEILESGTIINREQLPEVMGLPFQLQQLFINLVANSIKYRQQQIAPCITITSSFVSRHDIPQGQYRDTSFYYRITYTDNGIGFNQEHAEKIFELFRRVHTTGNQTGTGIGLTICKKILQNHNGFITATSEVNRGTIFEIYLPYEELSIHKTKGIPSSS